MRVVACLGIICAIGCDLQKPVAVKPVTQADKPTEPTSSTPIKSKPPQPQPIKIAATIDGRSLWGEYESSAIDAAKKYDGKYIKLSFHAETIDKAADGRFRLGFAVVSNGAGLTARELNQLSPKERQWFNDGYPPNVVCYADSDRAKTFPKIQKGDLIEVVARVVGSKNADVWRNVQVELDDVQTVSVSPRK